MVRPLIPDMGGARVGPVVNEYSKDLKGSIVEVGVWLGGLTQFITHRPFYVYDRFQALPTEVEKAKAFGINLTEGQDTLPLVKTWLPTDIEFFKGDIRDSVYSGPEIGIYIDDASKQPKVWDRVMSIFEPFFRKGTLIFLMDYHFPTCDCQREYAQKWEKLEDSVAGTSCALFRC